MKKSFLLGLMAMTLPLTAWAQEKTSINNAEVSFEYAVYAGTATVAPAVESVTVDGVKLTTDDYDVVYYTDQQCSNPITTFRHAGTYYAKITAKGESYEGETIEECSIDAAELTLTVGNTSKVYGTSDDALVANFSANYQPGDNKNNAKIEGLVVERVKGFDGEDVGSYTITLNAKNAKMADAWANDYTFIVTSQASLTITPKPLDVTFSNLTWTYGETETKLENVTVTANGYAFEKDNDNTVGLTWDYVTPNTTVHNAASYPIKATVTSKNYTVDATENIVVEKKDLTVTVENLEKIYGMNDPAFEPEGVEGWVYDDEQNVTVTLTRTNKGENVGEYTIDGCTVNSENYNIVYGEENQATLTIKAKDITDGIVIEVSDDAKVYQGQQANFKLSAITVKYTGKEVESINEILTADTEYTFSINEVKNAGEEVTVTVTAQGTNYEGTTTTTFKIAQAPLNITINDQTISVNTSKTADEQLDQTAYSIEESQLKAGDTKDGLGIVLYLDDEAAKGSLGTYDEGILFKADGEIAKNYTITAAKKGTLTINTGAARDNSITIGRNVENTSKLLEAYNDYLFVDADGKMIAGGFTVNVKDTRTAEQMKADYWYSMVLPFDITVPEFSNAVGYAVVNVPNKDNTNPMAVAFKLTIGEIPANTLFLFKTAKPLDMTKGMSFKLQGTSGTFIGDGQTKIDYDPDYYTEDLAGNKYYGVYENTPIHENGYFYLSGGSFKNSGAATSEVTIPILSGYIVAKGGSQARIIVEEADGSTTVINAVNADAAANAEGWYTVGGVKLNDAPTQKGIYINNGKKVVIK